MIITYKYGLVMGTISPAILFWSPGAAAMWFSSWAYNNPPNEHYAGSITPIFQSLINNELGCRLLRLVNA